MTQIIDNSAQILAMLDEAMETAADAVGEEAASAVMYQMESGYLDPVRDTGDLMRDVNFQATPTRTGVIVTVGNSLNYAPFVHDGYQQKRGLKFKTKDGQWRTTTGKYIQGRPYLKDGVQNASQRLYRVFADTITSRFDD